MNAFASRLLPALLIAACLALPAQARKGPGEAPQHFAEKPQARQESQRQRVISPEEAVRRARSEYPGKVLSVKLRGGGEFYAVKIIQNGRVRVVTVPAQSR